MPAQRSAWNRLLRRWLGRRDDAKRIELEIEAYLELRTAELRERGMEPEEARAQAVRAFGDLTKIRRQCRQIAAHDRLRQRWENTMSTLPSDIRFACRSLVRQPMLSAVAVVTLALGIGANTALFSVVHSVLLAPMPYPDPDRLVRLFERRPGLPQFPVAPGNYLDYRDSGAFEHLALYRRADLQLSDPDRPTRLVAMRVSAGFFEVLGIAPALGRTFTTADEQVQPGDTVILSHRTWRDLFEAEPAIIGRPVRLSGREFTVIGVMPPGVTHVGGDYNTVRYGERVDAWWPETLIPGEARRRAHFTNGVGRLHAGATLDQAVAQMAAVSEQMEQAYPDSYAGWSTLLIPLHDEVVGGSQAMLVVLLAAVGLVLLIACVNVANFMLARATGRRTEIAVRAAMGARQSRILRQLMIESLVLAAAGGAAGIAVGFLGLRSLLAIAPEGLPRLHEIALSLPVLGFAAGVSLATGVIFGIVPSIKASRGDLVSPLRDDGRSSAGGRASTGPRRVLVVVETALAGTLLIVAGLLLRSFAAVVAVDPGFEAEHRITASLSLPSADYPEPGARSAFYAQLREHLLAVPGIDAVAVGSDLPWSGYDENTGFAIIGWTPPEGVGRSARYHFRGPGFFDALGVPVVEGREFGESDTETADRVVVINEAAVSQYWRRSDGAGAGEPIGSTMNLWGEERRVVGVVADVSDDPTQGRASPAVYFPVTQMPQDPLQLIVRSSLPDATTIDTVRAEIRRLDPTIPMVEVQSLTRVVERATATQRFLLTLVGLFAAVALALAAIGIYGVLAYSVAQRSREIGIRMALGAGHTGVRRMVLMQGMVLIAAGLLLSFGAAAALSGVLSGLLFGISPLDPWSFVSSSLALVAIGAAACLVPAWKASRLEPVEALRR